MREINLEQTVNPLVNKFEELSRDKNSRYTLTTLNKVIRYLPLIHDLMFETKGISL